MLEYKQNDRLEEKTKYTLTYPRHILVVDEAGSKKSADTGMNNQDRRLYHHYDRLHQVKRSSNHHYTTFFTNASVKSV